MKQLLAGTDMYACISDLEQMPSALIMWTGELYQPASNELLTR